MYNRYDIFPSSPLSKDQETFNVNTNNRKTNSYSRHLQWINEDLGVVPAVPLIFIKQSGN